MSKHGVVGRCPAWLSLAAGITLAAASPVRAAPTTFAPPPPGQDLDCLAQAVYYEAGGETRTGREAVAQVVLNRLHQPAYPKTVCGVVFEGAERATGCQFTFACDGSRRRRPDPQGWREAQAIADDAMAGRLMSPVGQATHYHATWMRPAWSLAMTPVLRIGGHQFYVAGGRGSWRGAPLDARLASPAPLEPAPRPGAFAVWGLQVAVVTPEQGGGGLAASR